MGVSAQFILWIWCKTLQSFQPHYLFEHRSTQKYHHQSFTHLTAIVHQQNTMRWLKQKISHYILKSKVNTICFSFSFGCANPVLWCYEVSNICKSLKQRAQHSLVNFDCQNVLFGWQVSRMSYHLSNWKMEENHMNSAYNWSQCL